MRITLTSGHPTLRTILPRKPIASEHRAGCTFALAGLLYRLSLYSPAPAAASSLRRLSPRLKSLSCVVIAVRSLQCGYGAYRNSVTVRQMGTHPGGVRQHGNRSLLGVKSLKQ